MAVTVRKTKRLDDELRAELVIRDDAEAYWQLEENREEIDAELNQDLVWNDPEETCAGKERSKLMFTKQAEITDEERWDAYLEWMLERGALFHEVFYNRIQRL